MHWESLGFKENPFSTDPITQSTLTLYSGHEAEVALGKDLLNEKNVLLVIEGARGIGTTSFGNYLRFSKQQEKLYFTPRNEIRVEPDWSLETLLSVCIANIVREIELFQPEKMMKDVRFKEAKALSLSISEAYRSFGVSAFGMGVNYGKTAGISSQPTIVPSSVLGHHLEDLAQLIHSSGYAYGILLQLNNLDVGVIHSEDYLRYLLNAARDYFQTNLISWFLVGDCGLRSFIAQQVDRLDDIVSYEILIHPLKKKACTQLFNKRVDYYRATSKVTFPMDQEVFSYLYDVTQGRLRYVFGLLNRLMNHLHVGDLTDRVTLQIAKPAITQLSRERISRHQLSPAEQDVLKSVVKLDKPSVSEVAAGANKSLNHTSNILKKLLDCSHVKSEKQGRHRCYVPSIDAIIAYTEV